LKKERIVRKTRKWRIVIAGVLALGTVLWGTASSAWPAQSKEAGLQWPRPVPCRIADGANKDLFIITLGDSEPSLASGVYDPRTDQVRLKDGTVIRNYYRDKMGVKCFAPLDKSRFPLPPSGWCSWYYYYKDINEDEVLGNAQWIARNLKDYGAQYVQIDDGWQGYGKGGSRDWTTISDNFKGGMESLASRIRSFGLTPGIWIAPHGQSSEAVVRNNPDIFLLKKDGSTASETWEGKFLVDPSIPKSQKYMKDLFTKLVGWGYDYFKIDGQPTVMDEYRAKGAFMRKQGQNPEALYRKTLDSIRAALGPDRYLLGCWGIPLEGAGIMNGSRTGGDVVLGWDGFMVALGATLEFYYQHNIVWYTDPDVMLLRPPLSVEQARAWATLQGLTGQALFTSERLPDLPEERVEMLRRVYPAVDARPLDLFPSRQKKRVWDLKISHLGRSYDVVGVFNYDESSSEKILLSWKDLGLAGAGPVHVFDFWNKEYLGAWEAGMALDVPPTSCRVLTLLPASDKIQLVSTSRHITQGWVDLAALNTDDEGTTFTGKSRVIKGDPYELRFAFPRGRNFVVKKAAAQDGSGELPVEVFNHQGWAAVRIPSPRTGEAAWEVTFEPAGSYKFAVRDPGNVQIRRSGLDGADLTWSSQYYLNAGYQVSLNGTLVGYTPNASFPLRGLDPDATCKVEVRTVWEDGTVSPKAATVTFTLRSLFPEEIRLSELSPNRTAVGSEAVQAEWVLSRPPFAVGGKQFENGIGLRAGSEVEYDLKGMFDTFSARVALDDTSPDINEPAGLEFSVIGDGKVLWTSGILKKSDGLKPAEVQVSGVRSLVLKVTGGAESQEWRRPLADWVDAKLSLYRGA
jgi:hypothetical protein